MMSGLKKTAFKRALGGTDVSLKKSDVKGGVYIEDTAEDVTDDANTVNGADNSGNGGVSKVTDGAESGGSDPSHKGTENGEINSGTGNANTVSGANETHSGSDSGGAEVRAVSADENDSGNGANNAGTASGANNAGAVSEAGNADTASGTDNAGAASGANNADTSSGAGNANTSSGTNKGGTASNKMTYEQWLKARGYDPDGDFRSGAAELNYLYETWQTGYGARAENLYQIGLSDSGYADIFGVNAYASYVSAMNDLNIEHIRQNRKYKSLYADYCDAYDRSHEEKVQAAYQYAEELRISGYGEQTVRVLLTNKGYGDYIDEVEERLARFGDGYFEEIAAADLYASVTKQFPNYSGTAEEDLAIEQHLKASGVDDAVISAVIERMRSALSASSVTLAATDGSEISLTAEENAAVLTLGNRYLASLGDDEYIAETDESSVRGFLRASNVTDERLIQAVLSYISEQEKYGEETAKKREEYDIRSQADVIGRADASSLSFAELESALEQYAEYYGKDSQGYAMISSAVKKKSGEVVSAVLDRWSAPDSLIHLFGRSVDGTTFTDASGSSFTWADATDAQKRGAVEALVTQSYADGLISDDDYVRFTTSIVPRELALAESVSDASDALIKYRRMLGDGIIQPRQYSEIESAVVSAVSYRIDRINERSRSTHASVETSKGDRLDLLLSGGFEVSDADIERNGLDGTCFVILSSHLYVYDGGDRKLYAVDSLNVPFWTDEQENTMLEIFRLSARTASLGENDTVDNRVEPSREGGGIDAVSGKSVKSYVLPNGKSVEVPEEYELRTLPSGEIVAVPRDGFRGKVYTVYGGADGD